jgi:hypothetical protein
MPTPFQSTFIPVKAKKQRFHENLIVAGKPQVITTCII